MFGIRRSLEEIRRKVHEAAPVPPRETSRPAPEMVEVEDTIYRVHLDWEERPYWDVIATSYVRDRLSEEVAFYTVEKYSWKRDHYAYGPTLTWCKTPAPRELLLSIRRSDIKAIEVMGTQVREVPCE